jgi:hypothetical protein
LCYKVIIITIQCPKSEQKKRNIKSKTYQKYLTCWLPAFFKSWKATSLYPLISGASTYHTCNSVVLEGAQKSDIIQKRYTGSVKDPSENEASPQPREISDGVKQRNQQRVSTEAQVQTLGGVLGLSFIVCSHLCGSVWGGTQQELQSGQQLSQTGRT